MRYLGKICCFFIFARIFLHMCPNEKYEKYLNALTSWIAFLIFLSPFLSGDFLDESCAMWEREWNVWTQSSSELTEKFNEESGEAAAEIVKEMEGRYELEENR